MVKFMMAAFLYSSVSFHTMRRMAMVTTRIMVKSYMKAIIEMVCAMELVENMTKMEMC